MPDGWERRRSDPADYWQQAPYGFFPQIYCAEVKVWRPALRSEAIVPPLKQKVAVYPEAVKRRAISGWLWGAGFTLKGVKYAPERGEAYLTTGFLTRSATEMIQALYALNETWFMNDKYIYREVAEFQIVPPDFMARIDDICQRPAHPGRPAPPGGRGPGAPRRDDGAGRRPLHRAHLAVIAYQVGRGGSRVHNRLSILEAVQQWAGMVTSRSTAMSQWSHPAGPGVECRPDDRVCWES